MSVAPALAPQQPKGMRSTFRIPFFCEQTGMESYQGVKITCHCLGNGFEGFDELVRRLHHWTYLFSQLGLTPVHPEGAYGNQSFRTGAESFIITRSGMLPQANFDRDDFCHVVSCDATDNCCQYRGRSLPSSETLLHHLLYRDHPWIGAVLHGHSSLLLEYGEQLNIPSTATVHPYGTPALAHCASALVDNSTRLFNLKGHGFVALGATIDDAGKTTLDISCRLLALLAATR